MQINKYKLLKKRGEIYKDDKKIEYYMEPSKKENYILVQKSDYIRKDKIKEVADDYESKGYIEIAGAMRELLEERN